MEVEVMYFLNFAALVLVFQILEFSVSASSYIQTISKNEVFKVNMDDECHSGVLTFPTAQKLDCVCLHGIYSFLHYHKNCSYDTTWLTRAGQDHCLEMGKLQKFNRIELLISNAGNESLTIVDGKFHFVKGRYNRTFENPEVRKSDTLVVTGTWSLVTEEQSTLCVNALPDHYCIYRYIPKFATLRPGCHGQGKRQLTPWKCLLANRADSMAKGCPGIKRHMVAKREITPDAPSFMPALYSMAPPFNDTPPTERDEDYGLQGAKGSELIKNEIWNYLTQETANILADKKLATETVYVTPAFDVLQLSKKIMAKSCPQFYVNSSHWDMAVTSFIAIQQKAFKFRESLIDLVEYKRIKDTLQRCLANITEIPFIPPNETCIDGETVLTLEEGMYYAHGEVQTMNIIIDQMSTQNEPFIETVWKIFVHVHSLCFEYFKSSRINDHHRFTELLMQLFTNDVWDIWMKDGDGKNYELKKDVYAGLLGDAVNLMSRVDYCAWFPRFEANYPWDLIRPKQKASQTRRKRSIFGNGEGTCASAIGDFKCD